jgi:hypothetical protein
MQLNMFPDTDAVTADDAVDVPQPPPAPAPQMLTEDERRDISGRADLVFAENAAALGALRRASERYFGEATAGKTYKRAPGVKVTIREPAGVGGTEHRLTFEPQTVRKGPRGCEVDPRSIVAILSEVVPANPEGGKDAKWRVRLMIVLNPGPTLVRVGLHYPRTLDVDAGRLCRVARGFIEDPAKAVAASGTHCAFCGRGLTDPASRVRGIGPECFAKYGDFINWLAIDDPQDVVIAGRSG